MGANVGWAERALRLCRAKTVSGSGVGVKEATAERNPPDCSYFLINDSDSQWITLRCTETRHPSRACAPRTRLTLDVRKRGHLHTSVECKTRVCVCEGEESAPVK